MHFLEDKVPDVGMVFQKSFQNRQMLNNGRRTGFAGSALLRAERAEELNRIQVQSPNRRFGCSFCGPRLFKGATDRQANGATNILLCVRANDLRPFFGEVASTKQASSL